MYVVAPALDSVALGECTLFDYLLLNRAQTCVPCLLNRTMDSFFQARNWESSSSPLSPSLPLLISHLPTCLKKPSFLFSLATCLSSLFHT